jgi:hypothetical protein
MRLKMSLLIFVGFVVFEKTKLEFGTRFYDALIDSLDQLSKTRLERKALVVFSVARITKASHL